VARSSPLGDVEALAIIAAIGVAAYIGYKIYSGYTATTNFVEGTTDVATGGADQTGSFLNALGTALSY
jgi:hypothetical protein